MLWYKMLQNIMKKTNLQACININNNVWNAIYSVSASYRGR